MTKQDVPKTCNTCSSILRPQKKKVDWKKECIHPKRLALPKTEENAFGVPIYYPDQMTKCPLYSLSFQSHYNDLPIKVSSQKTDPSKEPIEPEPTVIQTPQTTLDDFF